MAGRPAPLVLNPQPSRVPCLQGPTGVAAGAVPQRCSSSHATRPLVPSRCGIQCGISGRSSCPNRNPLVLEHGPARQPLVAADEACWCTSTHRGGGDPVDDATQTCQVCLLMRGPGQAAGKVGEHHLSPFLHCPLRQSRWHAGNCNALGSHKCDHQQTGVYMPPSYGPSLWQEPQPSSFPPFHSCCLC
jgi:hypothetical protein